MNNKNILYNCIFKNKNTLYTLSLKIALLKFYVKGLDV